MTHKCPKCKSTTSLGDMILKVGGLLCPKCRIILFAPYVDVEFHKELKNRQKKLELKTKG